MHFGRDFLVAELPSRGHDLGHPLGGLVTLSRVGWHGGDEQRNHSGIEPIVLSQNPTRLGELAKLKWVDLPDGYARREQGTEDAALVATTRLNANGREDKPRRRSTSSPQPTALLPTQKHWPWGNSITSKRSLATSIPP